jgi:hypothetical protein
MEAAAIGLKFAVFIAARRAQNTICLICPAARLDSIVRIGCT